MNQTSCSVLFRCDGSSKIGLGHVMRCRALADALRSEHGLASGFAIRWDESVAGLLGPNQYPVFMPKNAERFDYPTWLAGLVRETEAKALVLDVRDELSSSMLESVRQPDLLLIDIDDPLEKRLCVDLAFYPPVPQVDRMDWTGFHGQLHEGWDWIPLRREMSTTPSRNRSGQFHSLLVTAGGADPVGMTLKIIDLLDSIEKPFETVVVVGPEFQFHSKLARAVARASRDYRVVSHPQNLTAWMVEADLAITSFGVTAYELAAVGVPAAYLCLTQDHAESASALAQAGVGITLGLYSDIDRKKFCTTLMPLLESCERRLKMSDTARMTIDGKGAKRISRLIAKHLEGARQ